MADEQHTKSCKACGAVRPLSGFFHHAGRHENLCKPCSYARSVEWRKKNAAKRVVETTGTKVCRLCGTERAMTEFPIHRQMIGGRAHECRVCTRARQKTWRDTVGKLRPEFVQARLLTQLKVRAKRYGLTLAGLQELESRANGLCDICQQPAKARNNARADSRLHVDHCHTTGKVRGMLCGDCNRGIGLFQDNPTIFRRAADYLDGE